MDRKDRKSDKLIRSVVDEKTRYNESKKLVLSSLDCFKVFRYLSLQMDDKSIKDIKEGTKLDVVGDVIRKFHKIVDYNEIKAKMAYFPVIGKRYYYLVKNKIVDALREEISLISPDKYLDEYFASRDERRQKSIVATQEGLEKLLVEFNDNTLSAKDFLRRAATTANCSEPVVIDEILTFMYSKTLPIVVKSYDKDVEQPRDLCEIRKFMVLSKPEFEILNDGNGIECYVRCCDMGNEEIIPLHFYGAIAKRVSKGRLEEFLVIEEKMRNNPNMPKVVKDSRRSNVRWVISRRMIVRGRIIGGVFFVFDFQEWIGDDVQWDVEKRYFHREDSYAFQIALDNVSREFRNKTEKAFLLLEDEVVARMKSVSNAYLETNDT